MQLLRRDADLRTETELFTVGEGGRGVDHHRGGVDAGAELAGGAEVAGHDCLGVAGAVGIDVGDCGVDVLDDLECDVEREVLLRPVSVGGGDEAWQVAVHDDAVGLKCLQ